ncbi:MAG: adenylate/guanylate cyclase domain-containing protein [Chlamydiales bacterium]|nr:adenylate/guanylate cyclase domain-containing protein [Chlamydiales bacterium]
MNYRTKLYFAFVTTSITCLIFGFGILLIELEYSAFSREQNKALTVATTTAALLDINQIKALVANPTQNNPTYNHFRLQLRRARDANRRNIVYIQYLYLITANPKDSHSAFFLADAEEDPAFQAIIKQPFHTEHKSALFHFSKHYVKKTTIRENEGNWIIAYAPIVDEEGNYIASIGANIPTGFLFKDLMRFIPYICMSFILAVALALAIASFFAKRVTLALDNLIGCIKQIEKGNLACKACLKTDDEFEELGNAINQMTKGLQEREHLKVNFSRYVSDHVLQKILSSTKPTKLEGERRKITVLFSDIRQFTHLSEILPPEQVVALLNEYFKIMLDIIFEHKGTLDKFIGDGLMVEFGAPLDDEAQERNAVITAIAMQEALEKLNATWKQPNIQVGIGIHTGLAIVGNVGSEKRMDYTAIGDTVNIASRLEQMTKFTRKSILISEDTYQAIKEEFSAENLGPITLTGRQESIQVYAIEKKEHDAKNRL